MLFKNVVGRPTAFDVFFLVSLYREVYQFEVRVSQNRRPARGGLPLDERFGFRGIPVCHSAVVPPGGFVFPATLYSKRFEGSRRNLYGFPLYDFGIN